MSIQDENAEVKPAKDIAFETLKECYERRRKEWRAHVRSCGQCTAASDRWWEAVEADASRAASDEVIDEPPWDGSCAEGNAIRAVQRAVLEILDLAAERMAAPKGGNS